MANVKLQLAINGNNNGNLNDDFFPELDRQQSKIAFQLTGELDELKGRWRRLKGCGPTSSRRTCGGGARIACKQMYRRSRSGMRWLLIVTFRRRQGAPPVRGKGSAPPRSMSDR